MSAPPPYELRIPSASAASIRVALGATALPPDESLRLVETQRTLAMVLRSRCADAFDALLAGIMIRLAQRPYFVRVRGLPMDKPSVLLAAVSARLGQLVEPYRQPWSRVIRHVRPQGDREYNGRVLNELLHTDGTDWRRPNDYTCLMCVCPDQRGGGRSRLLCLLDLVEELHAGPDRALLEALDGQSVPWQVAPELGGDIHRAPAIQVDANTIRWLRATNLMAEDALGGSLSRPLKRRLALFEQRIEGARAQIHFGMDGGDLLFVDNRRTLHARTRIPSQTTSARYLLRSKVCVPI